MRKDKSYSMEVFQPAEILTLQLLMKQINSSFKNYEKGEIPFSIKTIMRREYSGITATILGFVFVDVLRVSFTQGAFEFTPMHGYVTVGALLISVIFRSLKHYTKVLFEADRS